MKPPPALITAGGVDMARGHAGNIQPKAEAAVTPPVPRVVLSVETDSRRVPTAPRLIAGGKSESERPPPAVEAAVAAAAATTAAGAAASPWSAAPVEVVDKRDLPSANLPIAPAPVIPQQKKKKSGGWLRYAVVLMLLLLTAGIVKRVRGMSGGVDATGSPQRTVAVAPPLPPEATADPTATAAVARPRPMVAAQAPSEADPTAAPSADPSADPTADPTAEAAPDPTAVAAAPRPRLAPPPPKPTFKPLFELPQEKAKETP